MEYVHVLPRRAFSRLLREFDDWCDCVVAMDESWSMFIKRFCNGGAIKWEDQGILEFADPHLTAFSGERPQAIQGPKRACHTSQKWPSTARLTSYLMPLFGQHRHQDGSVGFVDLGPRASKRNTVLYVIGRPPPIRLIERGACSLLNELSREV